MAKNQFVIFEDDFQKSGSAEQVKGVTLIIEGSMKKAFDILQEQRGCADYSQVMSDILIAGLEQLLTSK